MRKTLLITLALFVSALTLNAQCEDWVSPSETTGWIDFDLAPCMGETEEITDFEVWQSEAYSLLEVVAGGSYTFSHCNGSSGTWVPEYTIIAPSGAIEAFGAGDGDGCSITWTAAEDGTYLVVINEAGNCGVEGSDNNGFPMFTNNSGGAPCPEIRENAENFEEGILPECWMAVDADGDEFNWQIIEGGFEGEGDFAMSSFSWDADGGPLTPDNYLITPQLALGTDEVLFYNVVTLNQSFAAENYSVLVSTTGNDIADFTDEVFTETLQADEWAAREIDLSAYNNQSIYIAFRHHDVTDLVGFAIDGVALPGEVNLDCAMSTEELSQLEDLSIFPNPNNGDFSIINNGTSDFFTLNIFDVTGKMVSQENIQLNTGSKHEVNLTDQPSGLYTLQFVSETQAGSFKVIVQ